MFKVDFTLKNFTAEIQTGTAGSRNTKTDQFAMPPPQEERLASYQLGSCVGQVPQGPQAVLDQSLAGVTEVDGQSLHAAGIDDGGLVARAHRQN